jgi:hypothetical protein
VRSIGETSSLVGGALLSGYGRDMELEADSLGAEYLLKAGYDPMAMVDVISVLKNHEDFTQRTSTGSSSYHGVFATHPRNDTRLQEVVSKAGTLSEDQKQSILNPEEFRERLEGLLEPLRDLFAAVFFLWIGLVTDPLLFAGVAGLVAVAVLVTTPTKLVSGFLGGRVYGLDTRRSVRVGLSMVTRGEFSLIIAAVALQAATVSDPLATAEQLYGLTVGDVLCMSILGSLLVQFSAPIEVLTVARLGD